MAKAKTKTKRATKHKATSRRKMSATLTLTQKTIDELAAIVGQGNFRYVARGKLGIPEGTFKSWLSRGRLDLRESEAGKGRSNSLQAKLVQALDRAESIVHAKVIENIMALDASDPRNVKIQLEFLFRRYTKLYSRNPNAHDDESGSTFPATVVNPLEALADKLAPFMDGRNAGA